MSHLKEAEPGRDMEGKVGSWGHQSGVYTIEEMECKICYNRYDTRHRKPKLLSCLHRVCAKCLKKMVDMGESSPSVISCPFCRHKTQIPDEEVWLMEDDGQILAVLSCQQDHRAPPTGDEVVLSPTSLAGTEGGESSSAGASVGSSDCLVITIMELPASSPSSDSLSMLNMVRVYRPHMEATPTCNLTNHKCQRGVPRCLLGALCLVYFSSLPLGIYLLMIQRMWMGVVMVSLVPSTLLLCVLYGFCQCVCSEILDLLHAHRLFHLV